MNELNNIDELIKNAQKIKLLYVEDNLQARESTSMLLKEFFADIIVAVNGEDGLAKFKNHQLESKAIDLVITDINMPIMDGLEMVKHIREIKHDIPVLVFSAYNEPSIFIETIKLGVDGYLLKPFDITQFTSLLDKIVQKIILHTKAQESEKLLILEKEQANKANQAKSQFLSSMSHELRTPMNAILGFTQIMQYDETMNDEQKDNLNEVFNAGQHLLNLINEVLDLAKIESGQIKFLLEAVKLSSLVDECFTLITPIVKKQGLTLHHGDMNGYIVYADRTRLKQVLINLLSNATKYNREQGSITLEASFVHNNEIRITIIDTGKGIAEDQFEALFEPFNRLNAEASNIEGTGIGLAITRNLVERMGGRIGVESQLNIGSQFWLELPMESSSLLIEEPINTETLVQNNPVKVKKQDHTILYIDDNPTNLKLVSNILARHTQFNLITSHKPALCLELAEIHHPQLILLDINMPEINGYQLLSQLHSDERFQAIPVVAVTANAMTKDIEQGKAAGFNDYLTKPINIAQLLEIIEKQLVGN